MEVHFRLVEEPPAARPASTAIERATDLDPQHRGGAGVAQRRPGCGIQLTVQDLGDQVLGHLEEILVRRRLLQKPGANAPGSRIPERG